MKNLILMMLFVPLFTAAQKTHTVKPKETLYSLARLYNVHPRELAAYNNISVETGLSLGQVIKIPAKTTMEPLPVPSMVKKEPEIKKESPEKKEPAQKKEPEVKQVQVTKTVIPAKKEGSTPIYHKVAKKETLYHISKLYNNVTVEDIKKWNKLTGDGVSEGTSLIVGYSKEAGIKTTETVKEKTKEEIKEIVKEDPKTDVPEKKEAEPVVKSEPVKKQPANPVRIEESENVPAKNFNGGIFKSLYEKQVKAKNNLAEESGQAGVFKSTSGWEDGKYYCLTNSATPGTIVKVTNPANNRSVYAKVLDLIPDLKQNDGLIIRISNAAAAELGAKNDNFESTINF
jgi:LysM repeat protein